MIIHNKLTSCLSKLNSELDNIKDGFRENELAYLALTSKAEMPIRDKLAYLLHKSFEDKDISVCREWNNPNRPEKLRTDLAIIQNEQPLALIELKAMYSFDVINDKTFARFKRMLQEDISKNIVCASDKEHCYVLLLVTHPILNCSISDDLKSVIKYQASMNRAFSNRLYKSGDLRTETINKLTTAFGEEPKVLRGGSAFGIEVEVFYLLMNSIEKDMFD